MTAALRWPKPTPRKKPLKPGQHRRSYIRAKRPRRLDTAQSNPGFLEWLHSEPCCLAGQGCAGPIEAHHAGKKPGMAMKAPDDTCIAMCRAHHAELSERRGFFKSMDRETLRAWSDDRIAETFGRWLSHGSRRTA